MSKTQTAQLITPQGKILSLPPGMYEAILETLKEWRPTPRATRAEMRALIEETRGKYAAGPSLVDALLAERATEREREMRRDRERAERFFKNR
jgi:radical SAM superfamily enzyme YgiQ (UPF0313 family)